MSLKEPKPGTGSVWEALSEREVEILELAVEGMTDQQIGNRLEISPSTVNSYWVRIRGKVGQMSRTEIVSRLLQERSALEIQRLRHQLGELTGELERMRDAHEHQAQARLFGALLHLHPEAYLAFSRAGRLVYASEVAVKLMNSERSDLLGCSFDDVFCDGANRRAILSFGDVCQERPKIVGLNPPIYLRARERSPLRVTVVARSGRFLGEELATCVVRSFTSELDLRREQLAGVVAEIEGGWMARA